MTAPAKACHQDSIFCLRPFFRNQRPLSLALDIFVNIEVILFIKLIFRGAATGCILALIKADPVLRSEIRGILS